MSNENNLQHISIIEKNNELDDLKCKGHQCSKRESKVSKDLSTSTENCISPIIAEVLAEEKPSISKTSTNDNDVKVKPLAVQSQVKPTSECIEIKKLVDMVRKHHIESKGIAIPLFANYFCLLTQPIWEIYRYNVIINPKIVMRQERIRLLDDLKAILPAFIYDGKQLFTTTNMEAISFKAETHTVTLKQIGILELNYKQSFQALNLILRRSMKQLNLQQIQHNYFNPKCKIVLKFYNTESVNRYNTMEGRLQLNDIPCLQLKHKILPKETIYDILQECIKKFKDYKNEFRRRVIGTIVYSTYNYNTYFIDDIDFDHTPKDVFKKCNEKVSFLKYYYTTYNLRIRDCNQPLLICTKIKTVNYEDHLHSIRLIPELCCPTGLSEEMITNVSIIHGISSYIELDPKGYVERSIKFNKQLKDSDNNVRIVKAWKMTLDKRHAQFKALHIDPPHTILQHLSNKGSTGAMANWDRVFKDFGMYWTPSRGLHRWAVIVNSEDFYITSRFVEELRNISKKINMPIAVPRVILIYDHRTTSYIKAIDECFHHDPQLVLCTVPNGSHSRYSAIKKKCYVGGGLLCQIISINASTKQHVMRSIATKVVFGINSKLSYAPWMIDIQINDLMTIGFHICDTNIIRFKKYGALVATMNLKENPSFFTTAIEYSSERQHADQVMHMLSKALNQYATEHGKLPYRILFYHSEETENNLYKDDIKAIVDRLHSQYTQYKAKMPPKFAYIYVTKSVSLRLFSDTIGTVVNDITKPKNVDFYLIGQHLRTSTMFPIAYNVLYSTLDLTVNQLQNFTYRMSHLSHCDYKFGEKIPSICRYAKKLADIISRTFDEASAIALRRKLYYL